MVIDGFTLFGSWPGLPYDHQVDELVNGLDRFKLDRACALSTQGIFFDAMVGNQTTWEICQQNPRLIPIGVADPRLGGEQQVEYCVGKGFKLMAVFPRAQGWPLSSLAAQTVLRRIADANLPLLVDAEHNGDPTAVYEATRDLNMPLILLDVSLSNITEAIAVLRARPNTYLATRLLCGGDTIEYLVGEVGAERLIFASRFPISCFSSAYLTARFASIDDASQRALMGDNIAHLIGI